MSWPHIEHNMKTRKDCYHFLIEKLGEQRVGSYEGKVIERKASGLPDPKALILVSKGKTTFVFSQIQRNNGIMVKAGARIPGRNSGRSSKSFQIWEGSRLLPLIFCAIVLSK